MFHYSRWRILGILSVVLLGFILALPNLLDPLGYRAVTDRVGLKPMTLGLDLQGGSNILMEVDRKDLTDKIQQQLMGDIRAALREQKIGYSGLAKTSDGVSVSLNKTIVTENPTRSAARTARFRHCDPEPPPLCDPEPTPTRAFGPGRRR